MPELDFWVAGTPRPKGNAKRGWHGRIYAGDANSKNWQIVVAVHAVEAMRGRTIAARDVPVEVQLEFVFKQPKKPKYSDAVSARIADGDKLDRAVWDGMTGIVFEDDAQVVGWSGTKRYGDDPGVRIVVSWDDPVT